MDFAWNFPIPRTFSRVWSSRHRNGTSSPPRLRPLFYFGGEKNHTFFLDEFLMNIIDMAHHDCWLFILFWFVYICIYVYIYIYICMVWYGMECNGMEWNGMEWNVMYVCVYIHTLFWFLKNIILKTENHLEPLHSWIFHVHLAVHFYFYTAPDQGCCYFWAAEAVHWDWDGGVQ